MYIIFAIIMGTLYNSTRNLSKNVIVPINAIILIRRIYILLSLLCTAYAVCAEV